MNSESRAIKGVLALVLAEMVAVVGFQWAAGTISPLGVLRACVDASAGTDALVAVAAVASLAGFALAWYLLATTVLYLWAIRRRGSSLTGLVRRLTFPAVRKIVEGAAVVSITASVMSGATLMGAGSALAQEAPVIVEDSPDAHPVEDVEESRGEDAEPADGAVVEYSPAAAGWPVVEPTPEAWVPSAEEAESSVYVVEPGDHFWSIAEVYLADELGRAVTEEEVCQYWSRLVDANRSTIQSGDPNLIYAGEQIVLVPIFEDALPG